MKRVSFSLIVALLTTVCFTGVVNAQDFTVPILVDGGAYTLTVSVDNDTISVVGDSDAITVGEVIPVLTAVQEGVEAGLDELKAEAVTVDYDDLFRNNEDYVGETVRYVGEVVEFQEQACLFCKDKQYVLRVAVTEGSYGIWDDPIWVDYSGTERFLEDDIVTVWGIVEGLESYKAVLGNTITIPRISAIDIVLGEEENPVSTQPDVAADEEPADEGSTTTDASEASGPTANKNANLRGGPGTDYPVVGSIKAGQLLEPVARNEDASWIQLDTDRWIAAFLIDDLVAPTELPVAEEIPEPPASAAAEPVQETESSSSSSPSMYALGDEIQGNGWRFNVKETHKRKSVYFYDDPDVAMGNWMVIIMDAVNEQSGSDHFANNIKPYLTDDAGNVYRADGKASGYAEWQYGGLSSIYSDVDPGKLARIAMAYDIPDGVGRLMLSTDLPAWVDLGNFGEMAVEE